MSKRNLSIIAIVAIVLVGGGLTTYVLRENVKIFSASAAVSQVERLSPRELAQDHISRLQDLKATVGRVIDAEITRTESLLQPVGDKPVLVPAKS